MTDKKGIAAMLVAKMSPNKGGDPSTGVDDAAEVGNPEVDEGKMICAEDMMRAVDEKDPKAFMAALDAYLDHRT